MRSKLIFKGSVFMGDMTAFMTKYAQLSLGILGYCIQCVISTVS